MINQFLHGRETLVRSYLTSTCQNDVIVYFQAPPNGCVWRHQVWRQWTLWRPATSWGVTTTTSGHTRSTLRATGPTVTSRVTPYPSRNSPYRKPLCLRHTWRKWQRPCWKRSWLSLWITHPLLLLTSNGAFSQSNFTIKIYKSTYTLYIVIFRPHNLLCRGGKSSALFCFSSVLRFFQILTNFHDLRPLQIVAIAWVTMLLPLFKSKNLINLL